MREMRLGTSRGFPAPFILFLNQENPFFMASSPAIEVVAAIIQKDGKF
jgi:hypothetical protein